MPRPRPFGDWPPSVKPYFGNPSSSSPFVQCYLPTGFSFEGRKSKSLSFQPEGEALSVKGTLRKKKAAVMGVQSWAWQWFRSLSDLQQAALKEADAAAVLQRPFKKARKE